MSAKEIRVSIGRRQFIGLMAGAAAGAATGFPAGRLFYDVLASADQPVYPPRGPEQYVLSVCSLCQGGCGVRVRKIGERIVKLEGNPLHPISGGRLCAKGQAAIQWLYHPDRVRTPLQRVGPRGSLSSFRRATWSTALTEIASRLQALREEKRPEALVVIHGSGEQMERRIVRRFLDAYGSPNDISLERGSSSESMALQLTQGVRGVPAYDVRGSDYILSLGSEFLEAPPSPVFAARAYGDFRQRPNGRRGTLIHVDPRLSITASSADEWIAIRPGTHGVFGLGVAAAIVAEGLYHREFISEHTIGFDDSSGTGLRQLLEERFSLERVATETGVSVNVILRVARELAGAKTGLVIGPRKGPLLPGRLFDHLAAHVLDALIGNIDQPGGVLVPEETPHAEWPSSAGDDIATTGLRRPRLDGITDSSFLESDPEQLADAILGGQPYRAEMLLVVGGDPLFTSFAPARFARALERVPLVVSFATIADDTALQSDWILPRVHFLEQWELHTRPDGVPFPLSSLAQPAAAKPLGEARSPGEVFLDLARRTGVESAFPASDLQALLRAEMDSLYDARRGAIIGNAFDEAWVRMMENAGWWAPGYHSADELWQRAQESGGWWDPFYDHGDWKRVLRTPSGRFDLRPAMLRDLDGAQGKANPSSESLALLLFEPLAIAGGSGAEIPFLQALLDPGHEERWETWGEIHPDTARAHGIREGSFIRVTSMRGSITVRARVTERVVAGTIAIPIGLGKTGGGRWAAGIGENPLKLLGSEREALSSLPDIGLTRVTVTEERRAQKKVTS